MQKNPLVSIIIPTKNSGSLLGNCLESIQKQTYKPVEVIIVDSNSTDNTKNLAKKYQTTLYTYIPKVPPGTFDAPHKRNYGVKKAQGEYVYYVDADMELTPHVIVQAVNMMQKGYEALIIPEDSFGIGIWASAKNLERRCYWNDDTVEAPRFFKKTLWEAVGGIDETIGGGGDDWDLYQKVLEKGAKVGRITALVMHNEGKLELKKLMKKRFMYGRETAKYIAKRPRAGFASYFPIRKSYLKNWKLFLSRPADTIAFIIMRASEYSAGFAGIVYSMIHHD